MTSFLAKNLQAFLEQKDIVFVIAGNGSTVMSRGKKFSSNHEKANSRITHIIKLALEQVMCTDYAPTSNLFFKIVK